ncbi:uncharacterized protein LOC141586330 [Silene latifolia]|uniref:uncharacterized protein LOC141586330 n=1 Tax=Silene latifolia TaxID=37657 RepID=UPI003D780C5D
MEEDQGGSSSNGGGVIDTAKADRSVWLMKCPLLISRSWNSRATSSDSQQQPPLAKVVISVDPLRPDDRSAVQFSMEMNGAEVGPRSYSLNMFKDVVPMSIFSEASQGKLAVEGKVDHKFDMKPHNENFEEYGRMCRERTHKSMVKNRQIQVIDNSNGLHMRPMPGLMGTGGGGAKDKKKTIPIKPVEMKRTRRDRGELEDIMFKLFEKKPNWALKQLVQETDQPAQFLKEILNELCIYNKRGTNQGTYELKPEYKKAVDNTGAE